jgi:hypothetical protein
VTVELDEHDPLVIVQVKTALVPTGTPDTADIGDDVLAIEAVPLKTVHNPVPIAGTLPANVKEPELQLD